MKNSVSRRDVIVGGATLGVISMGQVSAPVVAANAKSYTMSRGIADAKVRPATRLLLDNYGAVLRQRLEGSSIPLALACAIACQESAYTWYDNPHINTRPMPERMRLLVLDNVGHRCVFPRDTEEFVNDLRFAEMAPELIAVCDESRVARGYSASGALLYGYGLFQYDLQNIKSDPQFWKATLPGRTVPGLWPDVGACTDRLVLELKSKLAASHGDLRAAVAAYNGSGKNAADYAEIVLTYYQLANQEI